jgi:hypothetical protein
VTHKTIIIGWICQRLCIRDPDINAATTMGLLLPATFPSPTEKVITFLDTDSVNLGHYWTPKSWRPNLDMEEVTNDEQLSGNPMKLYGWYVVNGDENLGRWIKMEFTWEGDFDEIAQGTLDRNWRCNTKQWEVNAPIYLGIAHPDADPVPPPTLTYRGGSVLDWIEVPDNPPCGVFERHPGEPAPNLANHHWAGLKAGQYTYDIRPGYPAGPEHQLFFRVAVHR